MTMYYGDVFSWAEDENGRMVFVDDVPNGASCNCICPSCREKLIARHGNERVHGFAHASKERGANLTMCLKVILFKLAEHIVMTEKKICVPSYYGIYNAHTIDFETVEVNGSFEREDRQPDIVATTKDNQKYLIEFCFKDYVRHKQKVDYENLNCLEIDLEGQNISDRDSLKKFLIGSYENRRWLNNNTYFNSIEKLYESKEKAIKLVHNEECWKCPIVRSCCAVRNEHTSSILLIEHNSQKYRLCKQENYDEQMNEYNRLQGAFERISEAQQRRYKEILQSRQRANITNRVGSDSGSHEEMQVVRQEHLTYDENIDSAEKSCLNCSRSLTWASKDGWTCCGWYERLGLPKKIKPEQAVNCSSFCKK